MSSEQLTATSRTPCGAHGLFYDPARAEGCVLCVRERADAIAATRAGRRSLALLLVALCVLTGAVALGATRTGSLDRWLGTAPRAASSPAPTPTVLRRSIEGAAKGRQAAPRPAAEPAAEPRAGAATLRPERSDRRQATEPAARTSEAEQDRLRHERIAAELHARDAEQARERKHRMERDIREQEQRIGRRRVPVTMYKTAWCGACKRAAAYMQREGIPVREYDVEHDREARARSRALNPRGTVPTIDVDGALLIGWSEPRFEALLAEAVTRRGG